MPQAEALVIVIVNRTKIAFSFFLSGKWGKTPGGGKNERVWCFLVHSSALRWPALFMIRENSTNPLSLSTFFLPQLSFNANLRVPQMLKYRILILFITLEDRSLKVTGCSLVSRNYHLAVTVSLQQSSPLLDHPHQTECCKWRLWLCWHTLFLRIPVKKYTALLCRCVLNWMVIAETNTIQRICSA